MDTRHTQILTQTQDELYRWQLTLFNPAFKQKQLQVTHSPVKANTFKHRSNKDVSALMPICMDRISGKQLFSPDNMARLLCLFNNKFKGVKLNITIMLTGELYAWNILRKSQQEINDNTLAAARMQGRKLANDYVQTITPIINEFMETGHTVSFRHWEDVYSDSMVINLTNHLLERYKIDRDYTMFIDNALAKFFLRQLENGELITAKIAKKYNIRFLMEELAFQIVTYAFQHQRYEFQLYEYDELSPKLAETTLLTCQDFLAQHGLNFTSFGTFMLEYKQQELDAASAEYKKTMQASFAEMQRVFATQDTQEIGRYRKACQKMQLVVCSSVNERCESLINNIAGIPQDIIDSDHKYRLTEIPHHNFQLIPGAGIRTLALEGKSLSLEDAILLKRSIQSSLITLQYFSIKHSHFNFLTMSEFANRLNTTSNLPANCLIGVFESPNVCLHGFRKFEELIQLHPKINYVLYSGISNTELKKLQLAIKELAPDSESPTLTVKLMTSAEQHDQLQKFLYRVYSNITEHAKAQSTSRLEVIFDNDDLQSLLTAISECDVDKVKMLADYQLNMNLTPEEGCQPLIHAMSTEIHLRNTHFHLDYEFYVSQCQKLQQIITILIQAGAIHKEKIAPYGAYPLECAASNNLKYSFQALLHAGYNVFDEIDCEILNNAYSQALANKTKDMEIIRALEEILPISPQSICRDRKFC